jgi:hypothetical protein
MEERNKVTGIQLGHQGPIAAGGHHQQRHPHLKSLSKSDRKRADPGSA